MFVDVKISNEEIKSAQEGRVSHRAGLGLRPYEAEDHGRTKSVQFLAQARGRSAGVGSRSFFEIMNWSWYK